MYDDEGRREIAVERGLPAREAEMWEFYNAICNDRPLVHDGRWGTATLEACLAIVESSRTRRDVLLSHQVPTRD